MRRLACSFALCALAPALAATQPAAATAASWTLQSSPSVPANSNLLTGVAATSASNAWAAGEDFNSTTTQTLIEHWDGLRWAIQPSPSVGHQANLLYGVAATSAANAWAVGSAPVGGTRRTLILSYH